MIDIITIGLASLRAKFARMATKMPEQIEKASLETVLYVHSNMPKYPPVPSGSSYRRTGLLGRSVTTLMGRSPDALSRVENKFGGVRAIVGTKVKYSPWVIDENRQTSTHRDNGWWTLQGVVRSLSGGIRKVYAKSMREFLKRNL